MAGDAPEFELILLKRQLADQKKLIEQLEQGYKQLEAAMMKQQAVTESTSNTMATSTTIPGTASTSTTTTRTSVASTTVTTTARTSTTSTTTATPSTAAPAVDYEAPANFFNDMTPTLPMTGPKYRGKGKYKAPVQPNVVQEQVPRPKPKKFKPNPTTEALPEGVPSTSWCSNARGLPHDFVRGDAAAVRNRADCGEQDSVLVFENSKGMTRIIAYDYHSPNSRNWSNRVEDPHEDRFFRTARGIDWNRPIDGISQGNKYVVDGGFDGDPCALLANDYEISHNSEHLFPPPLDLICRGTFKMARKEGQRNDKWLLINIQNQKEFSCQVSRNVWSHSTVKSVVSQHFIYWQNYHISEVVQFYTVSHHTYVAILDPRTGERMRCWNVVDSATFSDLITEFLLEHPSPSEFGSLESLVAKQLDESDSDEEFVGFTDEDIEHCKNFCQELADTSSGVPTVSTNVEVALLKRPKLEDQYLKLFQQSQEQWPLYDQRIDQLDKLLNVGDDKRGFVYFFCDSVRYIQFCSTPTIANFKAMIDYIGHAIARRIHQHFSYLQNCYKNGIEQAVQDCKKIHGQRVVYGRLVKKWKSGRPIIVLRIFYKNRISKPFASALEKLSISAIKTSHPDTCFNVLQNELTFENNNALEWCQLEENRMMVAHQFFRRILAVIETSWRSGENPFIAVQPGQTFEDKSARHRIFICVHSGKKLYECSQCDYAATTSGNLLVHRRRHTGEKPYKCDQCDFAATNSADLTVHHRVHSEERPYKCSDCSYAAKNSSHLTRHRNSLHKID